MPQPQFDPTKVVASMEVFPKDDYEVRIGEPKAFIRQAGPEGNKHDSYGVRYSYRVMTGDYEGKTGVHTIYHHSDGAAGMAKQFLMAVLGYGRGKAEESRFDSDNAGQDFSCDYEVGSCGDFYRKLTGKRAIMTTEPQRNPQTGDEGNNIKGWRPVGS